MSNENDAVLVNRNGNTYQTTVEKMAELQDNDLVLVNREGTTYTITGEEIRESITNEIAPNITSVILEQDQTNGDRYTSNSFTSTVNYSEDPFPPASVEMVAKVEGVLGLDAGTSAIVQNNYPGTTSTEVELQLTNTQFIDDGVFEVGDEVKANESYTPETGVINSARVSQYDSSFGTSGTIDISALPGGEVFTIISVGPGFSGGRGNGSRGSTEPRGGAGASGGGAGPLYYRTFTREEYIAEYGNTYTQSLVNNFGGLLGYGGGTNAPNSTSYCGACIGSTGPAYPIDQAILDEINEALGGAMVLSKGAGGAPGGVKNNNSHSGGSGGGGAGGLVVTSTSSITVPTIPKGEDGGASTDGRGGYGGNGGTGWGAGGGGGGGDGDNGEINMTGAGGVGQAGINIVSIGNGQTILTFTDDKDIKLFQSGDEVQSGVTVVSTSVADKRINVDGGNWGASNRSQVWSNSLSFLGAKVGVETSAFDGDLSTNVASQTSGDPYSNAIVFTPPGGLSYTESVKVYCPNGQLAARINGGSWVTFSTEGVLAIGSGVINTIEITEQRINAGFGVSAYEVDGRLLVDDSFDDSQFWSQQTTSSFLSGYKADKAFNGVLDGQDGCIGSSRFTFDFTGLTVNSSLRIWGSGTDGSFSVVVGGQVITPFLDGDGWHVIDLSGISLPADFTQMNSTDTSVIIAGVEVDGKLLLDPGVRVQGSVSTISPKQGQGTISDISGAAVTIEPFTDNCFKEGQYLIHSTPKPILITPQTDAITEILTLADDESIFKVAGDKDLLNFVEDDKVYMCDSGGVIQEKNYTTSAVTATGVEDNYLQLYGANVTTGFNPGYDPLPNDYKQRIWDGDPNSAPQINQARTGDSFQVIFGGGGLPVPAGSTFQVTMPSVPDSFGASSYTVYINGDQSNSITDNNTPDNQIAIFNFGEVPGGVVTQVNTSCSWAEQRTTWGPSGFRINQETLVNDPKNYIYFADNSEFDKFSPGEEIATGVTIEAIESDEDKWQVDTFVGISNGQTFSTVPFQISADVVSVDVPEEQMTVDNVTDGWETTYFIKTLEKPAISQIGYLMFGSNGNITGVTLYPQDPVVMTSSNPRLTFPATFGTGITPDAELPYPASLSTTITSKNLFSDGTLNVSTADSNKLFPLTTTYAAPASGTSAYTTAGVAQLTANLSTFSGRAAAANSDPTDVQSALAAKQTEIDDYIAGL